MNYYEAAKNNLVAWAQARPERTNILFDTFGTRDVAVVCDKFVYRPDVITFMAHLMEATDEEVAKINEYHSEAI